MEEKLTGNRGKGFSKANQRILRQLPQDRQVNCLIGRPADFLRYVGVVSTENEHKDEEMSSLHSEKEQFFFSLDHALCLRIPKKPPVSLEHPSGDRGHETERHSEAHPGQQTQGHSSPLEKRVEAVVQQRNQHDEEQHVEQRQPSCRYLSQRNKT